MRAGLLLSLAVLSAARVVVSGQTAPTHHDVHRMHEDPKAYMAALDDPARDGWQKPHEVIEALSLRGGEAVADIGAGSGYFALRFARHVGPSGTVYAVDISPDMIGEITRRASDAKLANVKPILAKPDDPLLPAGGVDLVFICDTWHHVATRATYLQTLKRALKPGARLAIVDFHKDAPMGPPADMKLTREEVRSEIERAGFALTQEHTFLPHQYFLVFATK